MAPSTSAAKNWYPATSIKLGRIVQRSTVMSGPFSLSCGVISLNTVPEDD
jgi:hypothetical protein